MDKFQFNILAEKINIIIKLLSMQALGNKKGRELIHILSSFGLKPKDIAQILDTTSNTVRVELSRMRKKKGGKKINAKKG